MSCIMELIEPELSELPALELENLPYLTRVCAVDRHCRKMRQKNKCGAKFFHLAKVRGDNFLSSNLNSTGQH